MTAVNIFLRRDRAIMLTDAAMYDADGNIVGFGQKAIAMPALKAAVAVRGSVKATAVLALEMSIIFDSFDEIIEAGQTRFDNWFAENVLALADTGFAEIQIFVAGWSDKLGRPSALSYSSIEVEGEEQFEVIDDYTLAPVPYDREASELTQLRLYPGEHYRPADFDALKHGIALMEAQRRGVTSVDGIGGKRVSLVGGHILQTEITRDGVAQKVIHTWPDLPNQPIRPEPFRVPATAGLNRQQRRAMERAAR